MLLGITLTAWASLITFIAVVRSIYGREIVEPKIIQGIGGRLIIFTLATTFVYVIAQAATAIGIT